MIWKGLKVSTETAYRIKLVINKGKNLGSLINTNNDDLLMEINMETLKKPQ